MRNTLSVFAIVIALRGCKNPGADVAPAKVEATPEPKRRPLPAVPALDRSRSTRPTARSSSWARR